MWPSWCSRAAWSPRFHLQSRVRDWSEEQSRPAWSRPVTLHLVDKLTLAPSLTALLTAHPESTALFIHRSATVCFSLLFSSSSCAAASSLMATGQHTSSVNCKTSPRLSGPAADLCHCRAIFSLLQNKCDLRLCKIRCLHGSVPVPVRGS